MVDLTGLDPLSGAVWESLLELASKHPSDWTLIRAQMVALHGYEHSRILARTTADADVLVNVRVVQDGTASLSQFLVDHGFKLEGIDVFGVGHRFTDGHVKIDVLAPEGLTKGKSRLTTTIPPAHTVSVPGGTQALRRSRPVDLKRGERTGQIPCPDLLGAILVKARAVEVDDLPQAQLADLAFLLSLVDDPRQMVIQFKGKERSWLRRRKELLKREHPAWINLPEEEVNNGHLALRIMTGL